MKFVTDIALNAVDASAASSASKAIDASYLVAGSVHVIATGSPVGVVKIQASNELLNPANFVDVSSLTVSVSASGSFLIPKFDLCYKWIQIVYTKTSGTGAITANFEGIGF